jgi:transcriptional regulator with XRE-family HTH domain
VIIDGNVLRDYRNENNLTRIDLAQIVDLAPKTIQRIENGEPTKESTIKMIEEVLGIKLSVKDKFTDAQREAINYSALNLKVLAGAGAGKTRVVEEIIAKKISE